MKNYMHLDQGKANEPFAKAATDEVSRNSYIANIKDMGELYAAVIDFVMMYQGR